MVMETRLQGLHIRSRALVMIAAHNLQLGFAGTCQVVDADKRADLRVVDGGEHVGRGRMAADVQQLPCSFLRNLHRPQMPLVPGHCHGPLPDLNAHTSSPNQTLSTSSLLRKKGQVCILRRIRS